MERKGAYGGRKRGGGVDRAGREEASKRVIERWEYDRV